MLYFIHEIFSICVFEHEVKEGEFIAVLLEGSLGRKFFNEAIEFVFSRNWQSFENNFMQKLLFVGEMDNIIKLAVIERHRDEHRDGNIIRVIYNSQSKVSQFERKLY